ncbi:MAG: serine hydrolase [Cyanobium sp.]
MAFYSPDPSMGQSLGQLLAELEEEGRPGLVERLSISWLRYPEPLRRQAELLGPEAFWRQGPSGASWGGERLRYPASVVKLVYLIAAEAWLQRRLLEEGPELRRALEAMVRQSANDATSLVVDLLSGTCSGPALPPRPYAAWMRRRQLLNRWLEALQWPELSGCNACQKTWAEAPWGREAQFYGVDRQNRNRLSSDAVARLLHGVIGGALVSPPACQRMRALLERPIDAASRIAEPDNQVDGFLGAGLPAGARLWSKAGWMSQARHDAAYIEADGHAPMLLVVLSEGPACALDEELLPRIAARLLAASPAGL